MATINEPSDSPALPALPSPGPRLVPLRLQANGLLSVSQRLSDFVEPQQGDAPVAVQHRRVRLFLERSCVQPCIARRRRPNQLNAALKRIRQFSIIERSDSYCGSISLLRSPAAFRKAPDLKAEFASALIRSAAVPAAAVIQASNSVCVQLGGCCSCSETLERERITDKIYRRTDRERNVDHPGNAAIRACQSERQRQYSYTPPESFNARGHVTAFKLRGNVFSVGEMLRSENTSTL